jgi:hypothetical protein
MKGYLKKILTATCTSENVSVSLGQMLHQIELGLVSRM